MTRSVGGLQSIDANQRRLGSELRHSRKQGNNDEPVIRAEGQISMTLVDRNR
jgi:hypothetical protein